MFESILKFFYYNIVRNYFVSEQDIEHVHNAPVLSNINVITKWRPPGRNPQPPVRNDYASPWSITFSGAYTDVLNVLSWNVNHGLNVDCKSNLLDTCNYIGGRYPDVVCLQNIPGQMIIAGTHVTTYIDFLRLYLFSIYRTCYYVVQFGDLAILTKYPVTDSGEYLTPNHSMYATVTVNNQNYKIINCQLSHTIGDYLMVMSARNGESNKLPIQDMYNDILTQCYNDIPAVVCGKFALHDNPISKHMHQQPASQPSYLYTHETTNTIITNTKWCRKLSTTHLATDDTLKNTLYYPVMAHITLAAAHNHLLALVAKP